MNSIQLISFGIAAIIPFLAIYLIFLLDMFGTGKHNTVLICLLWGFIFAFQFSLAINNQMIRTFDIDLGTVSRTTAPFVEEILKSLILVYFIQRPRFRYIVDGAVYGFAAGIGFAVRENFFYLNGLTTEDAALGLAISRVLSASLMHATASSMVGIAFGRLRRSQGKFAQKAVWPLSGIIVAIAVHLIYNNAVQIEGLNPALLLLIGIGIGIGGSVIIGVIINQGLAEEKAHFAETLGLDVGVTRSEMMAVQELGSNAMEAIFTELEELFGLKKANNIRRLLVTQANIGILSNNLRAPASDRMKRAWQEEIDEFRVESDKLRNAIGVYAMHFLRGIFPEDDQKTWEAINESAAAHDPDHVHSFDVFMMASQLAESHTVLELEEMGSRLKKIEFFHHVDLADLENLSRAISERRFTTNHVIFRQGTEGDAMYMIASGGIDIFVNDEHGNEKYIRTFKAGSIVGELSLVDGEPRSATAKANGNLIALVLRRQHFNMFINSRPHVILAVLEFLAEKVRFTTKSVEDNVTRATAIAQGDYEQIRLLDEKQSQTTAARSPEGADRVADAAESADLPDEVHAWQPEELIDAAPKALGGAFAALATALESRESALQSKAKKSKAK
jgi:RsiW-degrading membrane proteinase PrsW (M82 family)/CRP-like cAMP-binding protein